MFTRNCDTQKTKFWALFNQLEAQLKDRKMGKFIADGELVYVDENGDFTPF